MRRTRKELLKRIQELEAQMSSVQIGHMQFANMSAYLWRKQLKPIQDHVIAMRNKYYMAEKHCLYCHSIKPVSIDEFNLIFSDFKDLLQNEIIPFLKKFSMWEAEKVKHSLDLEQIQRITFRPDTEDLEIKRYL